METIDINSSNYTKYQNIDIIAFSFANPGAQGKPGDIKIMSSNGILYHTNYIHSISLEDAFLVCPTLKDCKFNLFEALVPKGWASFYVGGGNFLVVKCEYKDNITEIIPKDVYNNWAKALYKII